METIFARWQILFRIWKTYTISLGYLGSRHPPQAGTNHRYRRWPPPPECLHRIPLRQRCPPKGLQGSSYPLPPPQWPVQEARLLSWGRQGCQGCRCWRRRGIRQERRLHLPRYQHQPRGSRYWGCQGWYASWWDRCLHTSERGQERGQIGRC